MIEFISARWKNMFSTGSYFNEITFNENHTVITGDSGAGKSTILRVINFCLYGKSNCGSNKANLINSKNKKNGICEVIFKKNNDVFLVRRCLKPDSLQIEKNGILEPETDNRPYQKMIEDIIGIDFKTFNNLIFISNKDFTSFIKMKTEERRLFVENIFDLGYVSKMREKNNKDYSNHINRINDISRDITIKNNNISNKKELLKTLENSNTKNIVNNQFKIDNHKKDLISLTKEITVLKEEYSLLETPTLKRQALLTLEKEYNNIFYKKKSLEDKMVSLKSEFEKTKNNTDCTKCGQKLPDHKESLLNIKNQATPIKEELSKISFGTLLEDIKKTKSDIETISSNQQNTLHKIQNLEYKFTTIKSSIKELEKEMVVIDNSGQIDNIKKDILILEKDLNSLNKVYEDLSLEKLYFEKMSEILKETSYKAFLMNEYIELINNLANNYLDKLGLYVKIDFDSNFKEVMKKNYTETYFYEMFSGGEQKRIDLAMLFVWREISKMRNNFCSNLLFFDEVFDSTLNDDALAIVLEFVKTLKEKIYIITHKIDFFREMFENEIIFEKRGDFSYIKNYNYEETGDYNEV